MQKENDTLLVAKLREGNKFAFEALYEKYSARLYNTIVLLENIEQCSQENHAKQDATPLFQLPGKHQPETHGFQTGDRRTRTTGRRGAHESIGIH